METTESEGPGLEMAADDGIAQRMRARSLAAAAERVEAAHQHAIRIARAAGWGGLQSVASAVEMTRLILEEEARERGAR